MSLVFYYGSGSPYVWRVQLALEHKQLPYELKVLSFSLGDTKKPEFGKLNPRHQVPVLVDGDFVLYESNAIVAYLDDAYPASGAPLFPGNAQTRALTRRLVLEIDNYLVPRFDPLLEQAFWVKPEERKPEVIESSKQATRTELELLTAAMLGDFLAGPLSAADFALYPFVAFAKRCEEKKLPDLGFDSMVTPQIVAWKKRMEVLPFFHKTIPQHWQAG